MFGLFGSKPKKNIEDELIPELKRHVVQIADSTGIPYLAIAMPMLSYGILFQVKDKGPTVLAQAINKLSSQLDSEQRAPGSLGSSIMEVGVPELPREHTDIAIDRLGEFASAFTQKGYSLDEIGSAMTAVSSQIAKAIDKDNLLNIGMLRRELAKLRDKYRREQFRQTATGELCTDESINALLRAEAAGVTLKVDNDRTFVLTKGSAVAHYLRSNSDIRRFEGALQNSADVEDANRSPVERLTEQGHKHIRDQNLEGAISAFSAALRISPNDRDLYFNRGVAWSNSYYNRGEKLDDRQKAIDDYTKSLQIDPEFAEAYFQRAGLLSAQGQGAAAIEDYGKAIEKDHKASSAYYCRGLLWQRTGESGKAKAISDLQGRFGQEVSTISLWR